MLGQVKPSQALGLAYLDCEEPWNERQRSGLRPTAACPLGNDPRSRAVSATPRMLGSRNRVAFQGCLVGEARDWLVGCVGLFGGLSWRRCRIVLTIRRAEKGEDRAAERSTRSGS